MTYDPTQFTAAENEAIADAFDKNCIFTIMPKVTNLQLRDTHYVFAHKYCNNCFYLNNDIYKPAEFQIAPSSTV